jgi:hypothetical protein
VIPIRNDHPFCVLSSAGQLRRDAIHLRHFTGAAISRGNTQ